MENCLVCDSPLPSGHVVVKLDGPRGGGEIVGSVCASHSLWEVIKHPSEFWLQITMMEPPSVLVPHG